MKKEIACLVVYSVTQFWRNFATLAIFKTLWQSFDGLLNIVRNFQPRYFAKHFAKVAIFSVLNIQTLQK